MPYLSFKIYMPLRTIVTVTINNWWGYESTLNLNIYPSVKDVQKTQGLCGVLNDNPGDDFLTPSGSTVSDNNDFSLSWGIDQADSFFDPVNHDPVLWDEDSLFCVCPAAVNTATFPSTSSGSKFDPVCSASLSLSCITKDNVQGKKYDTCNIRTKRSKQTFSKEIERILRREIMDYDIKSHNVEKRSITNITLEDALEECTRFFSNNCTTALFEDRLPNSNQNSMNSSITNCALDYTYTGDMSLATLHCETYRSEVDEEIERNSTFREANPNVVESFRSIACINDCNNHGVCANGSCICQAQCIEEDCSVSLGNYPVVEDTYSGGLCQNDQDECCGEVPIYGTRFVKGITKQRLELFADGTCFISGTCYSEREQNPINRCQQCQPTLDRFSWTYNCTSSNNPVVVKDMTHVIISVCIGTLVIMLVIVTINIIKCCLKKETRITGHFEIKVPVATSAPRTFDKTVLFYTQQSLQDYEIQKNGKNVYTYNATGNNRPETPGPLSFQKVYQEMELPELN
ncbi:hypothetical protein CHS0354_011420 [Potamilus streckersoni]|uniref:VWFD domain-containing protein n=1 Tax=Potamilus streckersoni TaxID=2493646 RepID=A0AAE0THG6_9BIVA|nr:hypothetical protein CHS0354_011420 [Potamilus streckersoni]